MKNTTLFLVIFRENCNVVYVANGGRKSGSDDIRNIYFGCLEDVSLGSCCCLIRICKFSVAIFVALAFSLVS